MTDAAIVSSSGRPTPPPDEPWVMAQSWRRLLFAHWPVAARTLRPLVPDRLELDTFDGTAWLGLTPFRLEGLRLRGLPPLPGLSSFLEMNLRTYVRRGGRSGVYFFALYAGSRPAVVGARALYGLPYRRARMHAERDGEWLRYESRSGDADLVARYRPTGEGHQAVEGTLAHFLVERYALYVVSGNRVLRTDIDHPPWRLRPAEARMERNTVPAAHGIRLPDRAPRLHYARRQDTRVWRPRQVG